MTAHHMRGHHMTSQCITWHHTTQEIASHKMKTHQITSHDMTWHLATNHITSPHVYFIAPCNQPHQNRSPHHHHGTAEGSFTQTTRFGHRSGWSPCAHSIGKYFLWLIVFFSLKLPPPACPALLGIEPWFFTHVQTKKNRNNISWWLNQKIEPPSAG